jgi:hypothetical protein
MLPRPPLSLERYSRDKADSRQSTQSGRVVVRAHAAIVPAHRSERSAIGSRDPRELRIEVTCAEDPGRGIPRQSSSSSVNPTLRVTW